VSLSFSDLGVPADLAERLARRGIAEPFPIQTATLPDGLAGRDLSGRAPTGSGKTLAFGIPLVTRVGKARSRRPRGLVLVPTRELAAQVRRELSWLCGARGRSVAAIYGGVGFGPQIDALRSGADIVVACPGRLADLVAKGEVRLDEVDLVVLDEADRMADMGFLPEVRRLLDQVSPQRQTLLFSATLDGDVDILVRRYQRNPVRHEVTPDADAPQSRHVFWRAERGDRLSLTAGVVNAEWPALVFCRTKRGADRLAGQLAKAGVSSAALHGNRSQGQRTRALAEFSSGRIQALVATDIAARGIHVDDVACVVHFDPPADEKDYVHRSGRTGRAGASGTIVSLVGQEQSVAVRRLQARLGLPQRLDDADLAELGDDRHLARVSTDPAALAGATTAVRDWAPSGPSRRPRPSGGRPSGPTSSRGPRSAGDSRRSGRPSSGRSGSGRPGSSRPGSARRGVATASGPPSQAPRSRRAS
jgi:superfamily II DNA/RNA helicase